MFALSSKIYCVQLFLRGLNWSDERAVVFLPVSYFTIGTSCKDLVLLGVESGLFEGGWLEKAQGAGVRF